MPSHLVPWPVFLFIRLSAFCLHGVLNCILFWKEFQCTLQKPCKIMTECSANFFQTIFYVFAYIFLHDSEIQRRGTGRGKFANSDLFAVSSSHFCFASPPCHPPPENIRNSDSRLCLTLYLPDILKLDTFLGAFASREEKVQSRICTHSQGRGR